MRRILSPASINSCCPSSRSAIKRLDIVEVQPAVDAIRERCEGFRKLVVFAVCIIVWR